MAADIPIDDSSNTDITSLEKDSYLIDERFFDTQNASSERISAILESLAITLLNNESTARIIQNHNLLNNLAISYELYPDDIWHSISLEVARNGRALPIIKVSQHCIFNGKPIVKLINPQTNNIVQLIMSHEIDDSLFTGVLTDYRNGYGSTAPYDLQPFQVLDKECEPQILIPIAGNLLTHDIFVQEGIHHILNNFISNPTYEMILSLGKAPLE